MSASGHQQQLTISGMSCGHCRAAVQSAISQVSGVTAVQVNLEAGTATVEGQANLASLIEAIEEAGYEATPSGN